MGLSWIRNVIASLMISPVLLRTESEYIGGDRAQRPYAYHLFTGVTINPCSSYRQIREDVENHKVKKWAWPQGEAMP
jgi:hypothetical protein